MIDHQVIPLSSLSSPNTVQHVAIRVNPNIEIWSENIMEPSYLLISKETVWLPDFPDIRQCQILDLICKTEIQYSPVISHSHPDNTPAALLEPSFSLNCSRGSFHICLRVIWNLYSCNYQDRSTLAGLQIRERYHFNVINVRESSNKNVDKNKRGSI